MSSWLIFSTLGLFPVAGQDVYLISTPSIPDASLSLGNGKKLHIVAKNLDPDGLNRYVQSATLNGVDLPNAWFRHEQIQNGATLILTMGPAPSGWGKGDASSVHERCQRSPLFQQFAIPQLIKIRSECLIGIALLLGGALFLLI